MIARVPVVRGHVRPHDMARAVMGIADRSVRERLIGALRDALAVKDVYLLNSGAASLVLLLRAMARSRPGRPEVILPAYTAGSLVVAVREAGLKPVLCDIRENNASEFDRAHLSEVAGKETLAVICVHLFGISMQDIAQVKRIVGGAYVIEDCAQSMGSTRDGSALGTLSDAAIFSFNRGKNVPACAGGCIATNSPALGESVAEEIAIGRLAERSLAGELRDVIAAAAFNAVTQPLVYGAGRFVWGRFRETAPPVAVQCSQMTCFSAALALVLLRRSAAMFKRRHEIGVRISTALRESAKVTVPVCNPHHRVVMNRIPLLFKEIGSVTSVESALSRAGIETSRMYDRPLHHMFDLGYDSADFPNACLYAKRLLTLPAYPLLTDRTVDTCIEVIRSEIKNDQTA